jgi:hypothetical protein
MARPSEGFISLGLWPKKTKLSELSGQKSELCASICSCHCSPHDIPIYLTIWEYINLPGSHISWPLSACGRSCIYSKVIYAGMFIGSSLEVTWAWTLLIFDDPPLFEYYPYDLFSKNH